MTLRALASTFLLFMTLSEIKKRHLGHLCIITARFGKILECRKYSGVVFHIDVFVVAF